MKLQSRTLSQPPFLNVESFSNFILGLSVLGLSEHLMNSACIKPDKQVGYRHTVVDVFKVLVTIVPRRNLLTLD